MRTKVLLTVAAALMLIVSMVAIGSNMGFKISIPLTSGWNNYVSIPYYNSYTTAATLINDVPNGLNVKRWDNPTGVMQQRTKLGAGPNFNITPGEAYIVSVSASGNWIVVGSHNPSLTIPLTSGYNNYICVPYHTTETTAALLLNEMPNALNLKRWDNASGTMQQRTKLGAGPNFALTAGEGYIASVSATTNTWVPAHY